MTKEKLWKLRQEIVLGSGYASDYLNDMGYAPEDTIDFFERYGEYLLDKANENGTAADNAIDDYDNADSLWDYWQIDPQPLKKSSYNPDDYRKTGTEHASDREHAMSGFGEGKSEGFKEIGKAANFGILRKALNDEALHIIDDQIAKYEDGGSGKNGEAGGHLDSVSWWEGNETTQDLISHYDAYRLGGKDESAEPQYWKKAMALNDIVGCMNDEDAYGSWIYVWPDEESEEQAKQDFGTEEDYRELEDYFVKVYKAYHDGGLYGAPKEVADAAHAWDAKLGLKPIKVIKEIGGIGESDESSKDMDRISRKHDMREGAGNKDDFIVSIAGRDGNGGGEELANGLSREDAYAFFDKALKELNASGHTAGENGDVYMDDIHEDGPFCLIIERETRDSRGILADVPTAVVRKAPIGESKTKTGSCGKPMKESDDYGVLAQKYWEHEVEYQMDYLSDYGEDKMKEAIGKLSPDDRQEIIASEASGILENDALWDYVNNEVMDSDLKTLILDGKNESLNAKHAIPKLHESENIDGDKTIYTVEFLIPASWSCNADSEEEAVKKFTSEVDYGGGDVKVYDEGADEEYSLVPMKIYKFPGDKDFHAIEESMKIGNGSSKLHESDDVTTSDVPKQPCDVIASLIDDEKEAVDGYDKASMDINGIKDGNSAASLALFAKIKQEELEHITELQGLLDAAKAVNGKADAVPEDKEIASDDEKIADAFDDEPVFDDGNDANQLKPVLPNAKADISVEDTSKKESLKTAAKGATLNESIKADTAKHTAHVMLRNSRKPINESCTITRTMSLEEFQPWDGAVYTMTKIIDANKLDDLDFLLEDQYPDGIDETDLNDLLWFESDWVLDQLGLKDDEVEPDDEKPDEETEPKDGVAKDDTEVEDYSDVCRNAGK